MSTGTICLNCRLYINNPPERWSCKCAEPLASNDGTNPIGQERYQDAFQEANDDASEPTANPNEFKTVGIVVDSYKVKRFRTVLSQKGFETKLKPGTSSAVAVLKIKGVHIDQMDGLAKVLRQLQYEFANRN